MKVVLQRVTEASVETGGRIAGEIGRGLCLLVGVEKGDTEEDARFLAGKAVELRIFPDEAGRMNLSLMDIKGGALIVSQFTLAGSVKKGRRPSFDGAEEPERAEALFGRFAEEVRRSGIHVETGVFRAMMNVRLTNDGPVTFVLDSKGREHRI